MIWQRIKNLWDLSSFRPDFEDDGHTRRIDPILKAFPPQNAVIIPYEKVDPIKRITEENHENQ